MHSSNCRLYPIKILLLTLWSGFLLTSCGGVGDPETLNGYWEIREVEFPDGQQKEYVANSTIDYFQLEAGSGYRKKVQPQVDGTFRTSDDAAPLTILREDDKVYILFEQEEGNWREEILKLTDRVLITRHDNGLEYTYERHNPLPLVNGTE